MFCKNVQNFHYKILNFGIRIMMNLMLNFKNGREVKIHLSNLAQELEVLRLIQNMFLAIPAT